MHENAETREWSVASDVTVKFLVKSVPSITRVKQRAVNIVNELCSK